MNDIALSERTHVIVISRLLAELRGSSTCVKTLGEEVRIGYFNLRFFKHFKNIGGV